MITCLSNRNLLTHSKPIRTSKLSIPQIQYSLTKQVPADIIFEMQPIQLVYSTTDAKKQVYLMKWSLHSISITQIVQLPFVIANKFATCIKTQWSYINSTDDCLSNLDNYLCSGRKIQQTLAITERKPLILSHVIHDQTDNAW